MTKAAKQRIVLKICGGVPVLKFLQSFVLDFHIFVCNFSRDFLTDKCKENFKKWFSVFYSLRASSPFRGYREKYTRERHARGDATAEGAAPRGFAARSCVIARLASLVQIGELARRLGLLGQVTPKLFFRRILRSEA